MTQTPTPPADATTTRRRVLYAGIGAVAALTGAGVSLWRWSAHGPVEPDPAFWRTSFDTPGGTPLTLQSFRGRPVLLNFWATWCPPCVEEMPLLDAFFRENSAKGWQVVGLAIDQPSMVRKFLGKTPVSYPIGFAGLEGTELAKSLGNETGGLPFTLVFDASGKIRERRMGKLSGSDLAQWSRQS